MFDRGSLSGSSADIAAAVSVQQKAREAWRVRFIAKVSFVLGFIGIFYGSLEHYSLPLVKDNRSTTALTPNLPSSTPNRRLERCLNPLGQFEANKPVNTVPLLNTTPGQFYDHILLPECCEW